MIAFTDIKGDTIAIQFTVTKDGAAEDIQDWKILAEITDTENRLQYATENAGGSDDEIKITDPTSGIFILTIPKDDTLILKNQIVALEVAAIIDGVKDTLYSVNIELKDRIIDWEEKT